VSVGFWFKTPSAFGTYNLGTIAQIHGTGTIVKLIYSSASGGSGRYFTLVGTTSVDTVKTDFAEGTWYWVTLKGAKTATSSLAIYDSSGNAVTNGTASVTGSTEDIYYVSIGMDESPTTATSVCYFDDVVIDWSTATFPLGP
jgi:hypothetical protein